MSSYFASLPKLGVTATVDAPTAEKARTTLLDYLERTGRIERSSRQALRIQTFVDKLRDPDETVSDLRLYYGYDNGSSVPVEVVSRRSPEFYRGSAEPEVDYPEYPSEDMEPISVPMESMESPEPSQSNAFTTPIGEVALKGLGGFR